MRINHLIETSDAILTLIERYETVLEQSEDDVTVVGKTLEEANREQGSLLLKYSRLHVEARNVVRALESRADALRATIHKSIRTSSDKLLGDRTIDKYVDGDQSLLDHVSLVIEIRALEEKFGSVVEAVKMRGFALNNITRARIESVHMAVL